MKKLLIIAVFVISSLQALPYRFTRLIGPANKIGQGKKIVNIFWEGHTDIQQPAPGAKKNQRYTMAERMLVENLQILNEKPFAGPADLLWELDPKAIKFFKSQKKISRTFIVSAGVSLHQEAQNQTNINFVLSDNLRSINSNFADLIPLLLKKPKIVQKKSILDLQNYLQAIIDEGKQFLEQAKSKLKQKTFEKLTKIWESTAQCLTNRKVDLGKQYKPDQTIGEADLLENRELIMQWLECPMTKVADFEMLTNILTSDKRYVILYVGGSHSQDVTNYLTRFGFKKVVDIGITPEGNKLLRQNGSDPILSSAGVRTILQAPRRGKSFSLLLDREAKKFINAFKSKNEQNFISILKPLQDVVQKTFVDLFNMQLNKETLLHYAIKKNWPEAVKLLLDQEEISIDIPDATGQTPLHHAITLKNLKIVMQLVKNGAHVNAKDKHGQTPLHYAAINNDQQAMKYLIQQGGADQTIKDKSGKKPADYAKKN